MAKSSELERKLSINRMSKQSIIFTFLVISRFITLVHSEPREYCFPKSFNVTCPDPDDVILMTSAKYGRMARGECVTSDYFVGCWTGVLYQVDRKCSGRNMCYVAIPDEIMHKMQPCPKDLLAYLEADYECVRSQHLPHSETCQKEGMAVVRHPGGSHGWVSSSVASKYGVGSNNCPWVIILNKGQTIKLTLYDFGISAKPVRVFNDCVVYAKVRDVGHQSEFNVCGGQSRERVVHQSEGNRVEVTLMNVEQEGEMVYFLLKYEAVGCSDPILPGSSMLLRREGDTAVVGCNITSQVWHIVCQGNSWFGKMDNCSHELMQSSHQPTDGNIEYFKNGLFVAVVIGLILGLLIGFLMLAVIVACNKSKRIGKRRKNEREDAERELQYQVKLHVNKSTLGASSNFGIDGTDHACEDSKKWGPSCFLPRHSPNVLDVQFQDFPPSYTLVYGSKPQNYQQLQQENQQQLQQNQHIRHNQQQHFLINDDDHHQFFLDSPQRSFPATKQSVMKSLEALNDNSNLRQLDVCPQQMGQLSTKFDAYEKPAHCIDAFCS